MTLKVMLSSLKKRELPSTVALKCHSHFHLLKIGASHSWYDTGENQWCLELNGNFHFLGVNDACMMSSKSFFTPYQCIRAGQVIRK